MKGSVTMRSITKAGPLALLLAACGLSTGPGERQLPGQPAEIELGVGEERLIPGTVLRIGFAGIAEDSRCPVDVTCVWEGNAAVEITVIAGSGPTQLRVLNTALEPRSMDFGGLRLTLVDVSPEPHEGEPIPPESYMVRLRLEALPS
jgi:hypothetical protein